MQLRLLFGFPLVFALTAFGQDWQQCKPEGDFSFSGVKAAVHRVTSTRMYSGWDEKTFNRSGDLVAVGILKTLSDSEISSPQGSKDVLLIVRAAFACPGYCVKVTDDRSPRLTLVLLEHLDEITRGTIKTDINETRQSILKQTTKGN